MLKAKNLFNAFVRECVRPKEGLTVIVGSKVYPGRKDRRLLYPECIGIDLEDGPGVDRVLNLEDGPADLRGRVAHVECCSVLEHSRRPWALAEGIQDALEPGGTLTLSVPWMWRFHGYPSDYFRFTPEGVKVLFPRIRWLAMRLATEGELRSRVNLLPAYEIGGHVAFGRAEILGFGVCES